MHKGPLWQFYLATALFVFVGYRLAAAVLWTFGEAPAIRSLILFLEAGVGLALVVGVWQGRRWAIPVVITLGALQILLLALDASLFSVRSPVDSLAPVGVTLVVLGALVALFRYEFRPGESNAERAIRSANDPTVVREGEQD